MFHKINSIVFSIITLLALALIAAPHIQAAPDASVGENNPAVQYDTWHSWQDANYSNGAARGTWLAGETATFHFFGRTVIWVTEKGNPMGMAKVWIDGVDQGTYDLYAAAAQNKAMIRFTGLGNTNHVLKIEVLGQKNPAAVSSYVFVDAFLTDNTKAEDNSHRIKYNSWRGQKNGNATGGSYRASRAQDAAVKFIFTGTQVKWITAKGPNYGKAEVFIDNVSQGVVDLYAPNQKWQVKRTYNNLSNGQHSLEVRVLGQKNPAATNSAVVIDGFSFQ